MTNPNYSEDTEWNDILREKGIIPEITQERLEEIIDETIEERNAIENKTVDELDELLDDELEDDRIIEEYKRQRMKEIQMEARNEIFGTFNEISKPQYQSEVSDASNKHWVVVLLYQRHIQASNKLQLILQELALKYRSTKFLRIQADLCIENYPDKNVPSILIYGNGELRKQLIGKNAMGNMDESDIEFLLKSAGALGKVSQFYVNPTQNATESDEGDEYE